MIPRLLRMKEKFDKYLAKLDQSPYYLAAQILNPQCRTSFLKDKETGGMNHEQRKKLMIVRKLWERFRDTNSASPYDKISEPASKSDDTTSLPAFYRTLRKNKEERTRPSSEDEFESYIKDSPINLPEDQTSVQWWAQQTIQYPRLLKLAIQVLSIPGMSDKPERVFSGARRRVPWDRTKTTARSLEQTECLTDWLKNKILDTLE